jgi:hypothetical protein
MFCDLGIGFVLSAISCLVLPGIFQGFGDYVPNLKIVERSETLLQQVNHQQLKLI